MVMLMDFVNHSSYLTLIILGLCQMSEREMLQKALTVSAMDYMKTETSSGSKQNEGKC